MRCKADWLQAGKPTKYFLNLEKANFNKKSIQALNIDGKLENNPQKI